MLNIDEVDFILLFNILLNYLFLFKMLFFNKKFIFEILNLFLELYSD